MDVAYPFLLELYHDYAAGMLSKDEFLQAVRLVESYVFRRAVCGIPTNSMNKTFATFARALKKDRYLESIQAHFLCCRPTAGSHRRGVQARAAANATSTTSAAAATGSAGWRTTAARSGCRSTNTRSSTSCRRTRTSRAQWKDGLGPEWERVQKTWLHTLGNLTSPATTPSTATALHREARHDRAAFEESPLRLNRGPRRARPLERGDDHQQRGERWPSMPRGLGGARAASGRPARPTSRRPTAAAAYTIDDHPHLAAGADARVFEAFRKEVLALDPVRDRGVPEALRRLQGRDQLRGCRPAGEAAAAVAQHDVPRDQRPQGICKDVTGLGRWGNGDVEVGLLARRLALRHGLVRQSFEKQMGGEEMTTPTPLVSA